jgi:hypothetical protein
MSLNVAALTAYVDEISGELAKQVVLQANTIKGNIIDIRYGGIGDSYALNSVKSTMYAVAASCGFTDTGSTIMAQEKVALCPIQFPNEICLDTLKKYYYDWFMERQFNTESLGQFEDVFVANKVESMAEVVDSIIWRGSNSSPSYAVTTGNLTLCDGLLQTAYEKSASTVNVTRTAITLSNAVEVVDSILANAGTSAPQIIDNFSLYLSPADFQTYLAALRQGNLYNYDTQSEGRTEINHPGSIGMKVVRTNGLRGAASGTFIATPKENAVAVVSSEEDLNFKMWFSNDAQALRMLAKLKIGAGFIFPELVVRSQG